MVLWKGIFYLYREMKKYRTLLLMSTLVVVGGFSFVFAAQEHRTSTLSLAADRDQDGLSNEEEALYGTDPDRRDTDNDGYSDGVEVRSGYDPLVPASEGDRLIGIDGNVAQSISGEDIAQARHLTNELRTRVAGIAFDVMSGKQVSLDDIDKEMNDLLEGIDTFDMPPLTVDDIRIKKQDYGDLSENDRKERVRKDVLDYITALSYIISLYAPRPLNTLDEIDRFAQEVIAETAKLEDDYTNISYFKKMLPRGEKMLRELHNLEVPEVMLPLHMEGLRLAYAAISVGKSFDNVSQDDPAGLAVAFARAQAVISLAVEFSDKVDEQLSKYNIN